MQANRGDLFRLFGTRCFLRRWAEKEFFECPFHCRVNCFSSRLYFRPQSFSREGAVGDQRAVARRVACQGRQRAALRALGPASGGAPAVNGVTGAANVGGLNNSGNDPSGLGNAPAAFRGPGTNAAGTANSSGSTSGTSGGAPLGSSTVGTAGNPAGGRSSWRAH